MILTIVAIVIVSFVITVFLGLFKASGKASKEERERGIE